MSQQVLHLIEFDYYYNRILDDNKHYITDEQLSKDMQHLFKDCVLMDKLQALSVLSTIKLIKS